MKILFTLKFNPYNEKIKKTQFVIYLFLPLVPIK